LRACADTAHRPRPPARRHILASFSPAQLDRYECFRRSVLSRGAVKKLTAAVAGSAPSLPTLIVIGGLAKQFVGELVEEGRRVMADRGEGGPLRPVHVQEAHRRLAARGEWVLFLACAVCVASGALSLSRVLTALYAVACVHAAQARCSARRARRRCWAGAALRRACASDDNGPLLSPSSCTRAAGSSTNAAAAGRFLVVCGRRAALCAANNH
jgi:transcription initiation factor TFIID subunit 11